MRNVNGRICIRLRNGTVCMTEERNGVGYVGKLLALKCPPEISYTRTQYAYGPSDLVAVHFR